MEVETSSSSSMGHPRRPPAHKSVSLRHQSQARSRSHEPDVGPVARPPQPAKRPTSSPSSLKPLIGKDDSGESSNAEKWFEKSNNHASGNGTSYVDDSPPFFLQNSSSDETPLEGFAARARNAFLGVPASSGSLPLRTGLLQLGTDNSSTEDFRSVIDDLTIENKKLKRKLRTYEKLQDSHLRDQKLFEVRVHGLPTQKKRELEEVLRKFAMGLSPQESSDVPPALYNTLAPTMPSLPLNKSGSSSASNAFADSAYHSNSASGQGSSTSDSRQKPSVVSSARSRHHNIQTYLHDIPEGLLPRHAAAMTEKARKKLVVRRLEHLYAGKGAARGGNQQPQQQQEVSQQAANNDRRAIEEGGNQAPREGVREANIMTEAASAAKEAADSGSSTQDFVKEKQPQTRLSQKLEQRPTRPLDLDPYRAQVPRDNFEYIRHLGFSPPGADEMTAPEDGHGWVYLNLLANMAQLHTINVTAEFVRKSLQEYSKKFEVSSDGRKVRWRGGKSVTKHSTDGDETPSVGASGSNLVPSDRGSPRKRLKTSMQGSSSTGSGLYVERLDNKLAYTPLFHHRSSNDDSDDESSSEAEDTNESAFPFPQAGDSSGMTSSGVKTMSTKKRQQREDGPIIFYNNAKFCTDLSGDPKTEESMVYNAFLYHNIVQQPVGTPMSASTSPPGSVSRGPLASSGSLPEAMALDDNPVPAELEVDFPHADPMANQAPKHRNAFQFEVSGLGGVHPADNFTINVESRHAPIDDASAPQEIRLNHPSRYPAKIARVLSDDQAATGRIARPAFHKEVVATRHEVLPPSTLPDASRFMPAGDTSPEDDDDDDDASNADDSMSDAAVSPDDPIPAAAPQPMELDYGSDESSEGDDDEADDGESDGSLDLLATARELDPEAVRAREREYDANMADRLAEEIPAGSSAATAGGGSGFASPGSGVDREEWELARKEALKSRREIKEGDDRKVERKTEGLKRRRSEGRVHNE